MHVLNDSAIEVRFPIDAYIYAFDLAINPSGPRCARQEGKTSLVQAPEMKRAKKENLYPT